MKNNYRAVHWGLDEGLSQGETYRIIKDAEGFLWIGTRYGLNRFDGNSFKVYTHQRNNNSSLIANDVTLGLVEDSLHNIWIGTQKGISRYNIKTEDFTNFFADTTLKKSVSASPFWATKNEVFCVEGESVITAYNIYSSAKKILAKIDVHQYQFAGIAETFSAFDSTTNSIWSIVENAEAKPGLFQIVLSTGKKNFFLFPKNISNSPNNNAEDLCLDATRKCIWVNNAAGLLQFTLNDNQFHHIKPLNEYERLKSYCRFVGITLDRQGRVWFATAPKGMIIYNPDDNSVTFPFPSDSMFQHDVSDFNSCIYCDRDNIIWSGFWSRKGIYEIVPYMPIIKHYTSTSNKNALSSNSVYQLVDAGNNKVWVTTKNGIDILDTKTGTCKALQKKDIPGIQLPDGVTGPITIDTINRRIWLYASGGVFRVDMIAKKCIPIIFKNSNNQLTTEAGYPVFDAKEIFFTALKNDSEHISVLNLNSDTAYEILAFPGYSFNPYSVVAIQDNLLFLQGAADENGNQTYEKRNRKWIRIYTPIDSTRWTSITYIKENNTYWVAAENQLFHFTSSFQIIKTYTTENGLQALPIAGLIRDSKGNIWFHTDRSIQELNITTGQIKTMSENDGFEKQNFDMEAGASKDAYGNIYYYSGAFGTGFNEITPGDFISTVSSAYLQSVSINQKPFPLKESINNTDTLFLNYDQTKIEIETGIIDFYSKGKSLLRYKLEGNNVNESWHYAPYYYTIRYDGLQPGNYKLLMQASNASNEFNGPQKVLHIVISPAFWNTWWFRIIAIVFVIAIVYFLIRWRLQQKYKLQFERLEKENQLAELKQQTSELEMQSLRAQMNPHFVFNCLSSINSFILKNKTDEASKYLTKFSRLIRMVLNNSKESFIALDDELETLRLYLDMEKLRFKNAFDYAFNVADEIEIENIFIPPLLLQPFAENAIWHGLMHKPEKGFLSVDLSIEGKFLTCIITDNGIGREQAQILKSKSSEKQKSMGLKITTERLSLLNTDANKQAFFTIEDLKDENSNVLGTRVQLKIIYKTLNEISKS